MKNFFDLDFWKNFVGGVLGISCAVFVLYLLNQVFDNAGITMSDLNTLFFGILTLLVALLVWNNIEGVRKQARDTAKGVAKSIAAKEIKKYNELQRKIAVRYVVEMKKPENANLVAELLEMVLSESPKDKMDSFISKYTNTRFNDFQAGQIEEYIKMLIEQNIDVSELEKLLNGNTNQKK